MKNRNDLMVFGCKDEICVMDIPADIVIKSTLKQGTVYYMTWDSFSSTEPHYFVVLSLDPQNNPDIAIVCAVSDIPKTKKRNTTMGFLDNTLVVVTPIDCPFLDHDSVFDCNYVQVTNVETLVNKLNNNEIRKLNKDVTLSNTVLSNLIQAVCNSSLVAEDVKNLIR